MKIRPRRWAATALLAAILTLVSCGSPAFAGNSDDPTPYTVDVTGVTLPAGVTFPDGGHVNLQTDQGGKGIHFESLNNQPSGVWIGQSTLPWSAFGLVAPFCVSWVQVSLYNEHYGEGGQPPVCVTVEPPVVEPPVVVPPVVEPPVVLEPPVVVPPVVEEPEVERPEPEPEPTFITDQAPRTERPTATPTPTISAAPEEETTEVLATTGTDGDQNVAILIGAAVVTAAGILMMRRRRRAAHRA